MSTHGCFAPPFPPSFFFLVVATRWWSPGARCHLWRLLLPRGCLLPRDGRRRLGVVRRLPGRRPCLFDRCCFCARLLKADLSNWCLYSDIVASADSCVFEPSRPLACNIKLVFFYLSLELCCDILPWVLDLDHTHLHVWLVYDWIESVTLNLRIVLMNL